jgi:hypothetical protein
MYAFLLLLAVTLLLLFGIPHVARDFGDDVKARFLEHGANIPKSAADLQAWINAHRSDAYGYACPVLFPLEFIFMFALAGAATLGAVLVATHVSWVSRWPWWIWCIMPGIYLAADFVEDVMLVMFLRNPDSLSPSAFDALSWATSIKIGTAGLAIGIPVILGAVALVKTRLLAAG